MRVKLRYRGKTYQLEGDGWRGPDGHVVHLLTWITDDLDRLTPGSGPRDEGATVLRVAQRLGEGAEVVLEPAPPWVG